MFFAREMHSTSVIRKDVSEQVCVWQPHDGGRVAWEAWLRPALQPDADLDAQSIDAKLSMALSNVITQAGDVARRAGFPSGVILARFRRKFKFTSGVIWARFERNERGFLRGDWDGWEVVQWVSRAVLGC